MQKQKSILEELAPSYLVIALALFGGMYLYNREALSSHAPLVILTPVILALVAVMIATLVILNFRLERQVDTSDKARSRLFMARFVVGASFLAVPLMMIAGFDFSHWIGTLYATHGYTDSIYTPQSTAISAHQLTFIVPGICFFLGVVLPLLGSSKLSSKKSIVILLLAVLIMPILTFGLLLYFPQGRLNS